MLKNCYCCECCRGRLLFFASDDMIALGVFHAIRELGLSCPGDVSVVGFDALDFAEFTGPSLSSVFQLGATVVSMLLNRVKGA